MIQSKRRNKHLIKKFVNQNPTIKNIVLANGKSGLALFTKHFSEWFESGELVLHEPGRVSSQLEASNANVKNDELKGNNHITCICAVSVSPAFATLSYEEKRDFWDKFVYSPGLKLKNIGCDKIEN